MNWFKRLCLLVFSLAGLASLAALALTWVGPWQVQARSYMFELNWYYWAVLALSGILALGLLLCLLRALFAPRNPRETLIAEVEGGKITVTRSAIVSQTKHIIETDGSCIASSVHVRMRKRGHVRVNVRVRPRYPIDVVAGGADLYARLDEGLAMVCGQSVESINIVYLEPERVDDGLAVSVSAPSVEPSKATAERSSEVVVSVPADRLRSDDLSQPDTPAVPMAQEPVVELPAAPADAQTSVEEA